MIKKSTKMSATGEKYKTLIPQRIRVNRQNTKKNSKMKENETDLKLKKIINFLYSDLFQQILLIPKNQFLENIQKKLDKIIFDIYPEYLTIKKSYADSLKKELNAKYIKEYSLLKKSLNDYIKNPNIFQLVMNFIPHCQKCEKIAYHNCINSLNYGKFIKEKENNDFVICVECKICYKKDLIEMYCKNCKKNYYSSIININNKNLSNHNNQKKFPFATWEKYHCGFIINEIMKCIKCKSNFYYDNINNKLICLNKNCKFESKPKSIIWKCKICSSEFISSVKAYNPLEMKIYKNSINYALLTREKARPYKVYFCNFCGGDVSKAIFYHKKDCNGELLMSKINNQEVVVCSKCHGMNFYSQYSWMCPFCDRKIKNKNILNQIKIKENYIYNSHLDYEKKILSLDKGKNNNQINKGKNYNNLELYVKINSFRNTINPIKDIKSYNSKTNFDKNKKYMLQNNSSNTFDIKKNKNFSNNSKKKSFFTIQNLFMRNDSEERNKQSITNLNSNISREISKESKSLEKSIKKKSTLFEILNKRSIEKSLSTSRDIKNSLIIQNNSKNSNLNINIKHNFKKINISLKEKLLRNKTENDVRKNDDQKNKQNSFNENLKRNEKIKNIIFKNNNIPIVNKLKKINVEIKKEGTNHIYKSIKCINTIKEYSLFDRQKVNLKENNKNKINKEKYESENKIINEQQSLILDKVKKKKGDFTKLFKKPYNILSFNKFSYSLNNKVELQNSDKIYIKKKQIEGYYIHNKNDSKKININSKLSPENEKNNKTPMPNIKLSPENEKNNKTPIPNIKPFKHKNLKKNNYFLNFSETNDNSGIYKKIENCKSLDTLKGEIEKSLSKRRYYQSLTKISKKNMNKNKIEISNFINNLNTNYSNDKQNKNTINSNKENEKTNTNPVKEININHTNTNNTNYNTNNDKTNNMKDNNENESHDNIDLIDFEEEEKINFVSDSKINSIINNNESNNILYNPQAINELIDECNVPKFETNDYLYKHVIGEGSYGSVFEVEEINTGNKYAIKKIICKDFQELIRQKAQLELVYPFEHENIMKIYKIQIKCLDISTYSINILMELALSDWNQEISKRALNSDYYNEKELLNIGKDIIKGLLFLKNKNIAHRDIKPQNILIFPNNIFKIADFGEAKNIEKLKSQRTLKGCELYMSPALYWGFVQGKKNLVHNIYKSDLFSLGFCLLYAMTLNLNILKKIRSLDDNIKIRNEVLNSINKSIYSRAFLELIFKMININEDQRSDLEEIYNDINRFNKYK